MTKIKKKFGFVVIIDALGAKNHTIDDSISFINSVTKLKQHIKRVYLAAKSVQEAHRNLSDLNTINTRFFGDTILFTLEVERDDKIIEYMFPMAFMLNIFFTESIKEGILFRGALAIGEYIETKDIVLGPAVVDAANWYEKIEMVAVMATPQARNYLRSSKIDTTGPGSTMVIDYLVPVKEIGSLNSYVFNWPLSTNDDYTGEDGSEKINLQWYYDKFKPFLVSAAVNCKYVNTEKFFKDSATIFNEKFSKIFKKK